jgi:16S rRNA processing protein RimM
VTGPACVIVGRIRKAHGVRGEVAVEILTEEPDAIFAAGRRVFAGDTDGELSPGPTELSVRTVRPFKEGLLVTFGELTDRTIADRWRDRYLLVPATEVEPPGEGEVWIDDLVGMRVELPGGAPLGSVREVYELPQGLVLEVNRPGAQSVILPFTDDVVTVLDSENRLIVVDPPEGMLD